MKKIICVLIVLCITVIACNKDTHDRQEPNIETAFADLNTQLDMYNIHFMNMQQPIQTRGFWSIKAPPFNKTCFN